MDRGAEGKRPRFRPWVGSSYSTDGFAGLRVMLLGESHYTGSDEPRPTITEEVVERYLEKGGMDFFTKAMRSVDPECETTGDSRRAFWNSVAFYQFVQQSVGSGPGQRPTDAMWKESVGPFVTVLNQLRPDAIVVFGKTLWKHLPPGTDSLVRSAEGGDSVELRIFATGDGHEAVAGHVTHATRLSYDVARPRIRVLLDFAGSKAGNSGV